MASIMALRREKGAGEKRENKKEKREKQQGRKGKRGGGEGKTSWLFVFYFLGASPVRTTSFGGGWGALPAHQPL